MVMWAGAVMLEGLWESTNVDDGGSVGGGSNGGGRGR